MSLQYSVMPPPTYVPNRSAATAKLGCATKSSDIFALYGFTAVGLATACSGGRPLTESASTARIPAERCVGGNTAAARGNGTIGPPFNTWGSSSACSAYPPFEYTLITARPTFWATLSAGLRSVIPLTPVKTFVTCVIEPSAIDSRYTFVMPPGLPRKNRLRPSGLHCGLMCFEFGREGRAVGCAPVTPPLTLITARR